MASQRNKNRSSTFSPEQVQGSNEVTNGGGRLSLVWKLSLFLGILCFLVYANTLKNGFAVDDVYVISKNTIVTKGISGIPELISTPHYHGWQKRENDTYRPLSLIMFAVEYQVWGVEPAYYHLVNILVYCCCVVLLFLFLYHFFERQKIAVALVASLLFALHPIHTEVVANIKSRDELLCFFFAFLSLNTLMRYARSGRVMLLVSGSLFFLLSLLSKETSVTLVVIIPILFWGYCNEHKQRSIHIITGIIAVTALFLLARYSILSHYKANISNHVDFIDNALASPSLAYATRIATAISALGYYLKLTLLPYPLCWDYAYNSIPYVTFADPVTLIVLVVYAGMAIFCISRLIKNNKDPYAFGILFYLITLALVSNIPFLIGSMLGERLLFFPSVGFCLIISLLLHRLTGQKEGIAHLYSGKVLLVLLPVCILYTIIVINRNKDWFDNYTLYTKDAGKLPGNARTYAYAASEIVNRAFSEEADDVRRKELTDTAILYFRKALTIYPDYDLAHWNLANTYFKVNQFDSAEVHELKAMKLMPNNMDVLFELARLYFAWKRYPEAIMWNKQIIKLLPGNNFVYGNMSYCYANLAIPDTAIYYTKMALDRDKNFPGGYEILSSSYKALGENDSATKYFAIAQQINPDFRMK